MKYELKTRRLILRPYRQSDYLTWAEYRTNPTLRSKKFFYKKLGFYDRARKNDVLYQFGIFEKNSGKNLGSINLAILVRLHIQSANLGYEIHEPFRKQGFASEAALAVVKFGFLKLDLHRIEAAMELTNKASMGVARSIGMKREGLRRSFYFDEEQKRWNDNWVYVALPEMFGMKSRPPLRRLQFT